MSPPSTSPAAGWRNISPALIAASSFAFADVLGKVVFAAGGDVLTLVSTRGVIGMAGFAAWLRFGPRLVPLSSRERWIAFGLGILFAVTVYCLFESIRVTDVPTTILAYFIYPMITGIVAAATGLERLGWRGALAAVVAFAGLALLIGARPGELTFYGVALSFIAAVSRAAMLLITRALLAKAEALLVAWHSLTSSTVVFVVLSLATWTWQPPQSAGGWAALLGISILTTVALLSVFISASRVGPFRTALVMNLEPLLATVASAIFLGDVIAPLQALGGAILLGALVAFQLRR